METLYVRKLVNLLGSPVLVHLGSDDDERKRLEPEGCFTAMPLSQSGLQVTRIGAIPVVYQRIPCLSDVDRDTLERHRGCAILLSERAAMNLMNAARQPEWKALDIAVMSIDARSRHGLTLLGPVEHARRLECHGFV